MSEIIEQEGRRRGTSTSSNSSSYATKRRTKQEIQYSCGCKYLFNHETVLEHVCSEHERELITFHG
jgi:hypothetical protein